MTTTSEGASDDAGIARPTPNARPVSRRALLGGAGMLALGAGGGALLAGRPEAPGMATTYGTHGGDHGHAAAAAAPPVVDPGPTTVGYGGGARPPASFTRADAEALAVPPPP